MVAIYEFVRLAIADQHRDKPFVLCKPEALNSFAVADENIAGSFELMADSACFCPAQTKPRQSASSRRARPSSRASP